MTGEIRITIDPGSEGIAKLEKLVRRAEDKAGLLKNIGEALLVTTDQRFEDQTDPKGNPWAPLKPLTVEIRGNSKPILTRTGRLRGAMNYDMAGDTLKLGPSVIYGAAQQFGATITGRSGPLRIPMKKGAVYARSVTLPPRPYVGFGPADEKAATETAQDWFDLDGGSLRRIAKSPCRRCPKGSRRRRWLHLRLQYGSRKRAQGGFSRIHRRGIRIDLELVC